MREPPEFVIWAKDLGLDARHHAGHRLVADLRKRLFAEHKESQVGPIAKQKKLKMVMPHPEVSLQRFLVNVKEVMIRSDAASGVHMLERLELRQYGFRQRLRFMDQCHHLVFPLRVQA